VTVQFDNSDGAITPQHRVTARLSLREWIGLAVCFGAVVIGGVRVYDKVDDASNAIVRMEARMADLERSVDKLEERTKK
jgi:hypothetical protein